MGGGKIAIDDSILEHRGMLSEGTEEERARWEAEYQAKYKRGPLPKEMREALDAYLASPAHRRSAVVTVPPPASPEKA